MTIRINLTLLILLTLYTQLFAAQSTHNKQDINTLPWEIITEKYDAKKPFCREQDKDGKITHLALVPDATSIALPDNIKRPQQPTEAELNLSVWQHDQWSKISTLPAHIDPNGLIIDRNTIAEGFYDLSIIFDQDDIGKDNNCYAIVTTDWKKDLLAWCRKNKEQIETNPDSQLIYSSIAVSHWDHLMELAGQSSVLSEHILSALSKTLKAKAEFECGNCPDLVIGLNKIRIKRFEGASVAEFAIRLPEGYDNSKKWPMLVYADPRRVGAKNNYKESSSIIILWWHFSMPLGYEWKDYEFLLDVISNKINLDKDRIYVNGECGNGIASIDLGLKYPDQWAECSASLGNASRQLAGNALNLPLIFVKGGHNEDRLVGYYDFAVECFKYQGCRHFKHSLNRSTADIRGKSVPDAIREISPYRVSNTIETLANPSSYWVQIDGREDENFIASIDAIVWGQKILVKTDNVDAYTLNLELAPLDCNRPVEIIENNEPLDTVTSPIFVKKSPKYENAAYVKNKSLHGPVKDVFTDPYAVVWKGDQNIQRLAQQLAGTGPCLHEPNLPADFVNTHNIIFVGRPDESGLFSKITDKLPVTIEDSKLTANGAVYEGDYGAIYVYPNPLNPQKYLAVLSGTTDKAVRLLNSAWNQIKTNDNADVGLFSVSENNKVEWLLCEKFNTVWDWHKGWDVPLAQLETTFPKWKWQQWVAHVLRKQLDADVMISEDSFNTAELPEPNGVTLRDIARIFKNDWIVKISIKGSDLRELLMVPFNDISSRQVSAPVIDGVTLVKQSINKESISINELENDRVYTAAFPYKAVNGERMGLVMKNYRLEGQGFLVPLLKSYLKENNNLDAELNRMQLNIF